METILDILTLGGLSLVFHIEEIWPGSLSPQIDPPDQLVNEVTLVAREGNYDC